MIHNSKYFYGNEISSYGLENGYVDYRTLAKAFDAVLNNNIIENTYNIGYWEQISGFIDHTEEINELQEKLEEAENELKFNDSLSDDEIELIKEDIKGIETRIESLENDQDYPPEIYQYYIVSNNAREILEEAEEVLFYNEELDMLVWGVTHWGTSWNYVLTNIKIELNNEV